MWKFNLFRYVRFFSIILLINFIFIGSKIITKDSKHLDLFKFFQLNNILKLNLSKTNIPPETLPGLIEVNILFIIDIYILIKKSIPKIEYLDLSDNSLNDAGLLSLCELLKSNSTLKTLLFDRNFDKPSKTRNKTIQSLSSFFGYFLI